MAQDPAEERHPYLVLIDEGNAQRSMPLGDRPVLIGRDATCDLILDDPCVSRQHARVGLDTDQAWLADLESTNGTFVNGARVQGTLSLKNGSIVRIGRHSIKFEWRARGDVEAAEELAKDLDRASRYVTSLLPKRITEGPVRVDWVFVPSAKLGGDVFGYHALDRQTVAQYMIDVAGHGVGAAMHSTSILSILRQRALPDTDFRDPGQVLSNLNDMFAMDDHDGLCFTIWYGVYALDSRTLRYGSAGQHPAYLVPAHRRHAEPLQVRNPMMGVMPGFRYRADAVSVPPGTTLYLFSDGVFEITDRQDRQWRLEDFLPCLTHPTQPGIGEPQRLYDLVRRSARPGPLHDDCSLMTVAFD